MINTKVFLKLPLSFKDKIKIYPPSVLEVVENDDYYKYIQVLTLSQEEIEDLITEGEKKNPTNHIENTKFPTPLEFLLINCNNSTLYEKIVKDAFQFFIKQEVVFLYKEKSILIGNLEEQLLKAKSLDELFLINETNFFEFQNLIRTAVGLKKVALPKIDEDPRIRQMKAKARYRDKIKAKQLQKDGITLGLSLAAICCMNMGLNPLNIGQISYASVSDLTKIYQQKESYETDIRSIQAGADSKKINPKYWIKENKEEN